MIIETFVAPPLKTNAYVIGCEETKKGVVIDPGFRSKWHILELAKKHQLQIEAIYLTHSHFDHIANVFELKGLEGWSVFIHPLDAENLRKPGSDSIPNLGMIQGVEPDGFFAEGEKRFVGKMEMQVIHTPGHTPGGVCFYFPHEKILFSGDTLFRGTYGRVDLLHSNGEDMKRSLQKLALLPSETVVYPGHGATTTIGEERSRRWMQPNS